MAFPPLDFNFVNAKTLQKSGKLLLLGTLPRRSFRKSWEASCRLRGELEGGDEFRPARYRNRAGTKANEGRRVEACRARRPNLFPVP
jgi:hypothetical protein